MSTLADQWEKIKKAVEAGDIEQTFKEFEKYFTLDAANCEHPTVKSLLESCAANSGLIAFEYYASTK